MKQKWSNAERVAVMRHLKRNILMGKVPGKAEVEKCQRKERCLQTRSWKNIKDYCRNKITMLACKVPNETKVDQVKEITPACVDQGKNASEECFDNCKEQDKIDDTYPMQQVEESLEESEAVKLLNGIEEPEQLNDVRRSGNCNSDSQSIVSEVFPYLPMTSSSNDCTPEAMEVLKNTEEPEQLNDVSRSGNCKSDSESIVSEVFPYLPLASSNQVCTPEAMEVLKNTEEPEQLNDVSRSSNCNSDSESIVSEVFPYLTMASSNHDCPPEAMDVENKSTCDETDACQLTEQQQNAEENEYVFEDSDNEDYTDERMSKSLENQDCGKQCGNTDKNLSIIDDNLYNKPKRFCIFCNKFQTHLNRHIVLCHRQNESVQIALKQPKEDRLALFGLFRREGIVKVNEEQAKLDKPKYQRERIPTSKETGEMVQCHGCQAFLSKRSQIRHKENGCHLKLKAIIQPTNLQEVEESLEESEAMKILNGIEEPEQLNDVRRSDNCNSDSESIVSEVFPYLPMTSSSNDCTPEVMEILKNIEKLEQPSDVMKSDKCDSNSEAIVSEVILSAKRTSSKKTKPYRYCVFCNKYQSKLSRHIAQNHQSNERVQMALQLPKEDRLAVFELFKREGILKVNGMQATLGVPKYERERTPKSKEGVESVQCPRCQAVLSKGYLKRHLQDKCSSEIQSYKNALSWHMALMSYKDEYGQEFVDNVLSRFKADNKTDRLCVIDPMLVEIGRRFWGKQKRKNVSDVIACESVMADMRQLASLYSLFKKSERTVGELTVMKGNVSDMLQRSNFQHLEVAVSNYAKNESQSSGLKQELYDLLKFASKIVKATYLLEDEDSLAAEVDKFVANLEVNKDMLFGDISASATNKKTKDVLKTPKSSPLEQHTDVETCTINKQTEDVIEIPSSSVQFTSSSSGRKYSKWSKCEEGVVLKYFSAYLTGEANKKIPGMKEIEQFLESQPGFRHDARTVHTKVMNVVYKRERTMKAAVEKKTQICKN